MALLLLALLAVGVVVVLGTLVREIRSDGYGHREAPRSPSAFDPRQRLP